MEDIKKIVEEVKSDINEMIQKGVGREMEGLGLEDLINETKNAGSRLASFEEKLGTVEKSMTDFILDAKNNNPAKKEDMLAKAFEANADKFKALGQRRDAAFGMNLKAVGDMNLTANIGSDWASKIAGLSNVILTDPFRTIHLRDILRTSTIEQNGVFKFAKKTGSEGGPAIQTEGSSKAQVDYDFTISEVTPKTIAAYAKISKQMLSRLVWLQSFVSTQMVNDLLNVEDTNLYDYAGTSPFAGLYESASTYTPSGTVTIASNRWDKLANSIAQLKALRYTPSAIMVNPIDEMELLINKESGAGYSHPSLLTGQRMTIAGVPIIASDIVTANTFMVGDFNKAAELLFEDNIMTEFAYEDGDNFTKNLVTVRVEESIALPIYFANAMLKGSFATS
jgi:HK97 family phage major capsid protein